MKPACIVGSPVGTQCADINGRVLPFLAAATAAAALAVTARAAVATITTVGMAAA